MFSITRQDGVIPVEVALGRCPTKEHHKSTTTGINVLRIAGAKIRHVEMQTTHAIDLHMKKFKNVNFTFACHNDLPSLNDASLNKEPRHLCRTTSDVIPQNRKHGSRQHRKFLPVLTTKENEQIKIPKMRSGRFFDAVVCVGT